MFKKSVRDYYFKKSQSIWFWSPVFAFDVRCWHRHCQHPYAPVRHFVSRLTTTAPLCKYLIRHATFNNTFAIINPKFEQIPKYKEWKLKIDFYWIVSCTFTFHYEHNAACWTFVCRNSWKWTLHSILPSLAVDSHCVCLKPEHIQTLIGLAFTQILCHFSRVTARIPRKVLDK